MYFLIMINTHRKWRKSRLDDPHYEYKCIKTVTENQIHICNQFMLKLNQVVGFLDVS
jgi:hypothetical protein